MVTALAVTLSLFWLMQYLIETADRTLNDDSAGTLVDFVRVKRNEEVERRQMKPEKPPQPEDAPPQPPTPQLDNLNPSAEKIAISAVPVETDMYRCGAILYGILNPELGFRPTMELKSRVVHLGDYPKGATVGYDRDTRLETHRRLACISIGYAAGYSRIAQDRGAVVIRGKLAPVLGKVSMNSIVADVTEITNVEVGDEAIVFGGDSKGGIGPDRAVKHFGTILPDLLSDWGMRNPRFYH